VQELDEAISRMDEVVKTFEDTVQQVSQSYEANMRVIALASKRKPSNPSATTENLNSSSNSTTMVENTTPIVAESQEGKQQPDGGSDGMAVVDNVTDVQNSDSRPDTPLSLSLSRSQTPALTASSAATPMASDVDAVQLIKYISTPPRMLALQMQDPYFRLQVLGHFMIFINTLKVIGVNAQVAEVSDLQVRIYYHFPLLLNHIIA